MATEDLPRRLRILYLALMAATGLLPLVPDEISVFSVLFALAFVAFCLAALPVRPRGGHRATSRSLVAFCLSLAISCPIALSNGVPFGEWLRGLVPFLFLLIYFVFPALTERDCSWLASGQLLAAACWTVKNLGRTLPEYLGGSIARITFLNPDFGIPFVLVALPFLLFFGLRRRFAESAIFCVVSLFVVIVSGYRAHALLVFALWIVFVLRQKRRRRVLLGAGSLAVGAAALVSFAGSSFGSDYLLRYQNLEQEAVSSRALEALYAVKQFEESPLVGKGLAYPVPIAINRFGVSEPPPPGQSDHVGYIHNLWLYLCMDLGLFGLATYLAFAGSTVIAGLRRRPPDDATFAAAATVITLLIYSTVEAAFHLIQVNLILGTLCAMLSKRTTGATAAPPPASR
jgi:O-antigen ligase